MPLRWRHAGLSSSDRRPGQAHVQVEMGSARIKSCTQHQKYEPPNKNPFPTALSAPRSALQRVIQKNDIARIIFIVSILVSSIVLIVIATDIIIKQLHRISSSITSTRFRPPTLLWLAGWSRRHLNVRLHLYLHLLENVLRAQPRGCPYSWDRVRVGRRAVVHQSA